MRIQCFGKFLPNLIFSLEKARDLSVNLIPKTPGEKQMEKSGLKRNRRKIIIRFKKCN